MLLEEVIQEIREDASDRKLPKDDQRIVVAAKDEAAVRVLEMLLVHGSEKVSNAKWEDFLKSSRKSVHGGESAGTTASATTRWRTRSRRQRRGIFTPRRTVEQRRVRGGRGSGPGIGRGGRVMGYNNAQGLAGGFSMPADSETLAKEALRRAEEETEEKGRTPSGTSGRRPFFVKLYGRTERR